MSGEIHALVVDDDPFITHSMDLVLSMHGLRVTTAPNGLAALAAYKRDPADILLTDLRMPHLDGAGLVARVRALNPEMPVIVVTGEMSSGTVVIEPSEARTTILAKPVSLSILLEAIQASLGRSPKMCVRPC